MHVGVCCTGTLYTQGSDSTVHRKRQRPKGYKEPGKRGVSSKHESPHTESAPMSDETLWNGLGYWEGLGEGLSGVSMWPHAMPFT